jgi:uncharacterized damage-inducible protein DinB
MDEDLRYPIGNLVFVESTPALRHMWIEQFRQAPALLRYATSGLSTDQLTTPYRPGGWTVAQVVHHLAEMDASAYTRLKFALTEDVPAVASAKQALWAETPDSKSASINGSLLLFEAVRLRWVEAWESLKEDDFRRQWKHYRLGTVTVDQLLQQYAWHARHHTAHIMSLRKRMSWGQ